MGGLLGAVLRPLEGRFSASWDVFGASWGALGASWGPLGASDWGGRLGFSVRVAPFGPFLGLSLGYVS
eukprot:3467772-Pyramimonas_sp.AAC.1